jgi:hypothetical protein
VDRVCGTATGGRKCTKTAKAAAAQNDTSLVLSLEGQKFIGETQSVNGMTIENSHKFVSLLPISPQ